MEILAKWGWFFGSFGCAGCPFFVLFRREKVWRGLHLDGKKFWKWRKMRVWREKSFWKRWKKFSLRVLLKPQFGEKRSMGRTMERKIGGEKSGSRCSRGRIGGCGKREFLENFWKIFWMFFLFSPSQREPKGDHAGAPLRKKWKKIKRAIRESPLLCCFI